MAWNPEEMECHEMRRMDQQNPAGVSQAVRVISPGSQRHFRQDLLCAKERSLKSVFLPDMKSRRDGNYLE
jgi:hypothetical protein